MNRTIVVAALAAWAITAADAQTNVYRWVDKDGKVQYSDTPPPKDARSSTQRTLGGGYPDTSQLPYATQMAMKKSPVTLFMSGDCGEPCDQGRALLGQRGTLGADLGPAPPGLDGALGDLRVDRAQVLALGDQPLGDALYLGPARKHGRSAVLDLALGSGALRGEPAGAAGRRLGEPGLVESEASLALQ